MNEEEIFEKLCVFDKRHPNYRTMYLPKLSPQNSVLGCVCYNCKSGRTELALEILRLREGIDMTINKVLNKALIGKDKLKSPDSNQIAQFVINYLEENDK